MIRVNSEVYQFTVLEENSFNEFQYDIKLEDIEDCSFVESDHKMFFIRKYDRDDSMTIKGDYREFRKIMTEYIMNKNMERGVYYVTPSFYEN